MKIILLEPQHKGIEHLIVNSSLIRIIATIFPDDEIVFIADRSHLKCIEDINRVKKIPIRVPGFSANSRNKLYKHFLMAMQIFFDYINMINIGKQKPDLCIALSVTPFTILFAKLILKHSKNYYICHEVMEYLPQQLHWWKFNYWIKPSLRLRRENNINIVLGDNIKEELLRLIPGIAVESIDHPYTNIKNSTESRYSELPELIKIGSVGFATAKKGFSSMFLLERQLRLSHYNGHTLELHHIGQLDKNVALPPDTRLVLHGKDAPLAPNIYNTLIEEMTFCVFFYPSDTYRLTASGALLDALFHLKPVIAITNPYFRYIFNKMGAIGYLCNTIDEIAEVIKGICIKHDSTLYRQQQETIRAGLKHFSLESVEGQVRNIFNKNNAS